MEASPSLDQIVALIERSNRILLCTHRKPDGDAVGSIMGLTTALKLMGKEVTAACADQLPDSFSFLPQVDQITQHVPGGNDFVVTLDCNETDVDRLKYHLEDNKIHIVITPKNGRFQKDNVSFQERSSNYDLIITVDVADIPQLGKLYEENMELFTNTPMINIDHHISNTEFGKINLIDVAASSTAEILYRLIKELQKKESKNLVTPDVATFLLSGVTTDTGSFQNANTTPKSMEIAAELMDAGASQQDIIKYLFRTKKLSTLKLWGRILTKIEVDPKHRLVWSSITQQDIKQSGAHMEEAGEIIDELLVHAPEAEMVALFKEHEGTISVSLRSTTQQANVMEIAQRFGGGGHLMAAGIKFPGLSLAEVTSNVLNAMQEAQRQRLGLSGITEEKTAEKQPGKVTQVMAGYTEPVTHLGPSIEERVEHRPAPSTPAPQKSGDLHDVAKAAITAEQSQASDSSFSPSQAEVQKERQKPQPDKRFTDDIPDFLKPPASPQPTEGAPKPQPPKTDVPPAQAPEKPVTPPPAPAPQPAPTPEATLPPTPIPTDDDVKVSYNNASTPSPLIPENSAEPVVTEVQQPPLTPPTQGGGQQGDDDDDDDQGGAAGTAPAPNDKPKPPKDPFAMGDDGLTDIERALGGL